MQSDKFLVIRACFGCTTCRLAFGTSCLPRWARSLMLGAPYLGLGTTEFVPL